MRTYLCVSDEVNVHLWLGRYTCHCCVLLVQENAEELWNYFLLDGNELVLNESRYCFDVRWRYVDVLDYEIDVMHEGFFCVHEERCWVGCPGCIFMFKISVML